MAGDGVARGGFAGQRRLDRAAGHRLRAARVEMAARGALDRVRHVAFQDHARALALNPEFIICDEAVSALDVSIQAQIVNLLEDLRERFRLTYLFIAHDLSLVRHLCQRVAVMYLGRIVELADCDELFDNPLHPYTQALLAAVPVPDPSVEAGRRFRPVKGEVPSPINPPSGCVFHPRCPIAVERCKQIRPELRELRPGHWVACSEVQL